MAIATLSSRLSTDFFRPSSGGTAAADADADALEVLDDVDFDLLAPADADG
jgi:hypothetical protein